MTRLPILRAEFLGKSGSELSFNEPAPGEFHHLRRWS